MDLASVKVKIFAFIKKYRYVALVLVVGLFLMTLPTAKPKNQDVKEIEQTQEILDVTCNERLAEILSKVEGAGNVQILLTVAAGEEIVYQTNDDIITSNETNTTKIDTVIVTDAERNQNGLVRQVNPPRYLGAVIVCEGAESATVRLALIDAVSKVTGLSTDRISVLKMK